MNAIDQPRICRVDGCGRPVRARGYCQTHYKHLRKEGKPRPIKAKRPPRPEVVRFAGFSLTPGTVAVLVREAKRRGITQNALVTDILESWAKRRR